MCVSGQIAFYADLIKKVESRSANDPNINPIIRKTPWTHNRIQTNQANPLLPDNKAADKKIATEKTGNASGASRKNRVAVNRAAVSKAEDKTGCSLGTSERREVTPAAFLF